MQHMATDVLSAVERSEIDETLAADEKQDGAVARASRRIRTVWCCVTCDRIRFEDSALPPTSGRCQQCGEQGIERRGATRSDIATPSERWHVETIDSRGELHVLDENRLVIARVDSPTRSPQRLADASLIASAPVLRDVLRAILERSHGRLYDTDQETGETFDRMARAALDLAEGCDS
jgi:hypothetical protein